jgi:hypothetical protein
MNSVLYTKTDHRPHMENLSDAGLRTLPASFDKLLNNKDASSGEIAGDDAKWRRLEDGTVEINYDTDDGKKTTDRMKRNDSGTEVHRSSRDADNKSEAVDLQFDKNGGIKSRRVETSNETSVLTNTDTYEGGKLVHGEMTTRSTSDGKIVNNSYIADYDSNGNVTRDVKEDNEVLPEEHWSFQGRHETNRNPDGTYSERYQQTYSEPGNSPYGSTVDIQRRLVSPDDGSFSQTRTTNQTAQDGRTTSEIEQTTRDKDGNILEGTKIITGADGKVVNEIYKDGQFVIPDDGNQNQHAAVNKHASPDEPSRYSHRADTSHPAANVKLSDLKFPLRPGSGKTPGPDQGLAQAA